MMGRRYWLERVELSHSNEVLCKVPPFAVNVALGCSHSKFYIDDFLVSMFPTTTIPM
jgi:hypothetical protein